MNINQIIFEVRSEREESQGYSTLSQSFFSNLHQTEMKYIKLKHGKKTKQSENQLIQTLVNLIDYYAECVDYFGSISDSVCVYFQFKIKQINKYYQFFNNIATIKSEKQLKTEEQQQNIKDLGSISDQTGPDLLPQDERQNTVGKEALTQNLIVCLQSQNISSHIKQNQKKVQKIQTKISESIKNQEDLLFRRKIKRKNTSRSRAFLSFRQSSALDLLNRSPDLSQEVSDISDLIMIDMEALQADSPQKMKERVLFLDKQKVYGDFLTQI